MFSMFRKFRKMICLVSFVMVLGLVLPSVANAADPSLVGYWPFDVSTADDWSAYANHGVVYGNPKWVPGKFFEALHFDGVDDYVKLTNQPPITNGFTFSAWVKRNGDIPSCQEIFNNNQFFLRTMPENENSNNPFEAFVKLSDGSPEPRAQSNVASTIGQWFFVTVTWDKTTLKIYVNSELKGSSTRSGELTSTTVEARIGRGEQTSVNMNPFNGLIDEVRIYNRVLTQEEIQQTMTTHALHRGAIYPEPANKAIDVPRDVTLSWEPGKFAAPTNGHKVYFGESFDDVNDATGGVAQTDAGYTPPQRLDFGTTYYWRVDEVNAPPDYTVFKGRVWSFTVEPIAYSLAGEYITAIASSLNTEGEGPSNIINDSGLNSDDLHSTETVDMWLSSDTAEPPAWIQYEFDKVYKLHEMWVWNHNTAVESLIGFGFKDVTIEYSVNSTDYTTLGNTHEFARASGAADYAHNTTVDFSGVPAKYVRLTANSNWGGILDQYGLSEVRFFYIPVRVREPSPDSGATDVELEPTLGFRAGREAAMHDVYFGSDEQAVIDGNTPVTTVTETSYGPLSLDLGKTYYWRVDEVNETEILTIWQGDIWNFTTQEYFVVDDFEDYDAGENQIWYAWKDGLGYGTPGTEPYFAGNGTGSAVGDETTDSYTEETIVHSGSQSMPFFYDNNRQDSLKYSEAEMTLSYPRDWTEKGISTLTIWFRGNPAGFVEEPAGTFTISASGADIWDTADEFRYAFKQLSGAGWIVAKVESVENTDAWTKAGVMIRETLDPDSKFAAVYITPGNGCRFQGRLTTGASATSDTSVATAEQMAIQAPYWVKLERDASGNFNGYYSSDGVSWQAMTWNPQRISMSPNVYIGLALTSHSAGVNCEAEFSNVQTTGTVSPPMWTQETIGIVMASNDPEPMYVALNGSAVVSHDNPDAAQIAEWTEWTIDLQAFADQGVNLANVNTIALGLGDKKNPLAGGSGTMYFDDIRLYPPPPAQ